MSLKNCLAVRKRIFQWILFVGFVAISALNVLPAAAATYTAGQTFHHSHYLRNTQSCDIYVTAVRKAWRSTGGVLNRVDNKKGSVVDGSSTNQSGEFYYTIPNYRLRPGEEATTVLDFYTKDNKAGSVTTTFTFYYTSSCGSCDASADVTSNIKLPDADCKQSRFTQSSATPGEQVTFEWNIENPGGQVRLVCGEGGFNIVDQNVNNSGSKNFTLPTSLSHGDVVACNLYVGSNALCGDNLPINGIPSIQIDKTDKNGGVDQDGIEQNDTQTINEGDTAKFKITVTNNGSEPLKNVVITDAEAPNCARTASETQALYSGSTFAPGHSFSYTCTKNNVTPSTFADGDNDISVTGTGNTSNQNVSDQDPSTVVLVNTGTAQIEILKWAANPNDKDGVKTGNNSQNDSQSINSGTPAVFRIQVKNVANVALKDVLVNDNNASQCALSKAQVREILTTGSSSKASILNVSKLSGTNNNDELEPNEGFKYDCTTANINDGYINEAVTIGTPVNGNPDVTDNDPTTVLICDESDCPTPKPGPRVKIIKTDLNPADIDGTPRDDTQTIYEGDQAVFEITVISIGDEPLKEVVITDAEAPGCELSASETLPLYPGIKFDRGELFTYTCNRNNVTSSTFVDGDNDIRVDAKGYDSNANVNHEDPSLVVLEPTPAVCGNGVVEPPEQCDDGNTVDGDGCSSICEVEPMPTCTGADFDPDAVLAGNTSVFSWNTLNISDNLDLRCSGSAGFNLDVAVPANGTRNITVPNSAALGTDTNCEIFYGGNKLCEDTLHTRNTICGDGLLETGEMCDDGNTVDGDGCSAICELEPACVGTPSFNPNPTTPNSTSIFSWDTANTGSDVTLNCSGSAGVSVNQVVPSFGTFDIHVPITAADNSDVTCRLKENGVNIPSCNANLTVDTSVGPYCGDGIVQAPEQCDDGNTVDDDLCSNTCQIVTPPNAVEILKWAANPGDRDGVVTGDNTTNDTQTIIDGATAIFNITVTNIGTESLENVVVTDDEAPECALSAAETLPLYAGNTFDAGESFTYVCEKTNATIGDFDGANAQGSVDGSNDARVDAVSTVDGDPTTDQDPSEVVFIRACTVAEGEIQVIKDDSTPGQPDTDGDDTQTVGNGGTAEFTIIVSNPGTSVISDVVVSDPLSPSCARDAAAFMALLGAVGNNDDKLDPGEVVEYTCTQAGVTANYTNTAEATGLVQSANCGVIDNDTSVVVVGSGPGGFCGDGIVQAPEQCDLGAANGQLDSGCSATCASVCVGDCGGSPTPNPSVGTCTFHEVTLAPQCTRQKPVEDVSDPLWQAYRECRDGITTPRHTGVGYTLAELCAMDWAEDNGFLLCGPVVAGVLDPYEEFPSQLDPAIAAQCDKPICENDCGPTQCVPVETCVGCFGFNSDITKQVKAVASDPLGSTATVAKGETATYQIDVNLENISKTDFTILEAQIRVYDKTIPTESGNIWNRDGIIDGDGHNTWMWCDENALCPEFGEYFYMDLKNNATRNYVNDLNSTGRASMQVHYDMDTMVSFYKDAAKIDNVAFAVVYVTYQNVLDPSILVTEEIGVGGDDICTFEPKVSNLAFSSLGDIASVNIIRPFIKAKAGNAGYFGNGEAEKAFGDQNNILLPSVTAEDQNYGLTLTDDTTMYTGVEQGDADEFAEFQDQQDDFYNNLEAATSGTVTLGGVTFDKLPDANVYLLDGTNLDVAAVAGITASSTFIITNGDVLVNSNFNLPAGVFAAFIIRDGNLLIDKSVTDMDGLYLVEQGEIMSRADEISDVQLIVSGNLFGDLGHLLAYRRYIGTAANIEPSIAINFDLRLLDFTPPMLEQFLGAGWREDIQG